MGSCEQVGEAVDLLRGAIDALTADSPPCVWAGSCDAYTAAYYNLADKLHALVLAIEAAEADEPPNPGPSMEVSR